MIRERVLAGIARARSEGRALGRKRLEETDAAKVAAIRTARGNGFGLRRIATDPQVGVGTVLRVLGEGKIAQRRPDEQRPEDAFWKFVDWQTSDRQRGRT